MLGPAGAESCDDESNAARLEPVEFDGVVFWLDRGEVSAAAAVRACLDVVGLPNHGILRIGDTLTEGEDLVFRGVPSFAPEILRRITLGDAMKAKKLREALKQLAEEGVVQLFIPQDGSGAIVGMVGALQLDVLQTRLNAEYGLPVAYEMSRFTLCRWISSEDKTALRNFIDAHGSSIALDIDGDPLS